MDIVQSKINFNKSGNIKFRISYYYNCDCCARQFKSQSALDRHNKTKAHTSKFTNLLISRATVV
jgi:hypothetical protein